MKGILDEERSTGTGRQGLEVGLRRAPHRLDPVCPAASAPLSATEFGDPASTSAKTEFPSLGRGLSEGCSARLVPNEGEYRLSPQRMDRYCHTGSKVLQLFVKMIVLSPHLK